jgi:asparagine synthetase B (glutamine-hydrolysing)
MIMAHGLESRVPLLDHPLVEFAATVPADVKFAGGDTKHLLKRAFGTELPMEILHRRDKMGFPVPLKEWFSGQLRDFVQDIFRSQAAQSRPFMPVQCLQIFRRPGSFRGKQGSGLIRNVAPSLPRQGARDLGNRQILSQQLALMSSIDDKSSHY